MLTNRAVQSGILELSMTNLAFVVMVSSAFTVSSHAPHTTVTLSAANGSPREALGSTAAASTA